MPEMPEVETILTDLKPLVLGRRIASIALSDPSSVKEPQTLSEFGMRLAGTTIVDLYRIGKHLIFALDTGDEFVVHLRMTGQLVYDTNWTEPAAGERCAFQFDGGGALRFIDRRRLGTLHLVDAANDLPGISGIGPDPLSPGFTARDLWSLLRRRKSRIKPLLMDQKFLAGLGNIYVNEALYRARIRPTRRAHTITREEARRLHRAIRYVLRKGVATGGASVSSYRRPDGSAGRFQETFEIYDRAGATCPACEGSIKRIVVGGRGTYYCPHCQR
jgi:formamidopyrimidine-DNA glycosylase